MIIKSNEIPVLIRGHWAARGLAGIWPMMPYEVGSTIIHDLSGNGYDGTLLANTHFVRGEFGPALEFDGTGDAVNCGTIGLLEADSQTIVLGLKHTGDAGYLVASRYDNVGGLSLYFNGSVLYAYIGNTAQTPSNTTLTSGVRYQIALVYNSVASTITYYVNGVNDGADLALTGVWDDTTPTYIGARGGAAGVAGEIAAQIDHLMIYKRALAVFERTQLIWNPFIGFERDPIELWSAATLGAAPPVGMAGAMTTNTGYWGW